VDASALRAPAPLTSALGVGWKEQWNLAPEATYPSHPIRRWDLNRRIECASLYVLWWFLSLLRQGSARDLAPAKRRSGR